jgi:octaprenyl-diphosphate synthase
MKHGSPEHAACVRNAIENGGRDDFPAVLEAIRVTGAIEATRKVAEAEAELALNALNQLSPSIFKDSLIQLSHFAVARKY